MLSRLASAVSHLRMLELLGPEPERELGRTRLSEIVSLPVDSGVEERWVFTEKRRDSIKV